MAGVVGIPTCAGLGGGLGDGAARTLHEAHLGAQRLYARSLCLRRMARREDLAGQPGAARVGRDGGPGVPRGILRDALDARLASHAEDDAGATILERPRRVGALQFEGSPQLFFINEGRRALSEADPVPAGSCQLVQALAITQLGQLFLRDRFPSLGGVQGTTAGATGRLDPVLAAAIGAGELGHRALQAGRGP